MGWFVSSTTAISDMITVDAPEFTASFWMNSEWKTQAQHVLRKWCWCHDCCGVIVITNVSCWVPPYLPESNTLNTFADEDFDSGKHYLKVNFSNRVSWAGRGPELLTALPTFPFPFIPSLSRQGSKPPPIWCLSNYKLLLACDVRHRSFSHCKPFLGCDATSWPFKLIGKSSQCY